jgi:hypothetical protein
MNKQSVVRALPYVAACLLVAVVALPSDAQETHSPTMSETVAWISQQVFVMSRSFPEATSVTIDPRARGTEESLCGTHASTAAPNAASGCSPTCYGGCDSDGCSIRYVYDALHIAPIRDCSGDLVLSVEHAQEELVTVITEPVHEGTDWYCRHSSGGSTTAHIRMTIRVPLSEYAWASNRPDRGDPTETFWLTARDFRDVIHLRTEVTSSYFGRGGTRETLVHQLALRANTQSMGQRLATAFNHIAELCAGTRPAEPF